MSKENLQIEILKDALFRCMWLFKDPQAKKALKGYDYNFVMERAKKAYDITKVSAPEVTDPKCLSCKFYCVAPGIAIWCDKLGVGEDMPTKACDKYRKKEIK